MQQSISPAHGFAEPGIATPSRQHAGKVQSTLLASTASSVAKADPGYVYLSISRSAPGFVQIASARQDPQALTSTVPTDGGAAVFQTVHTVRTTNCAALMKRFHAAAEFNQIPRRSELFQISLRFARNILDLEAYAYRPSDETPRPKKKSVLGLVAGIVAMLALLLALLPYPSRKATSPASAERVAAKSASATPSFTPAESESAESATEAALPAIAAPAPAPVAGLADETASAPSGEPAISETPAPPVENAAASSAFTDTDAASAEAALIAASAAANEFEPAPAKKPDFFRPIDTKPVRFRPMTTQPVPYRTAASQGPPIPVALPLPVPATEAPAAAIVSEANGKPQFRVSKN